MTNVKALEYVLANYDLPAEVAEKVTNIRDSYAHKGSTVNAKPTAQQVENEGIKAELMAALADGSHKTATELMGAVKSVDGITNQRVSALMRLLKLDGKVEKETVKGKTYFYAVA